MKLFVQILGLHGLFSGKHLIHIAPDGIDFTVVHDQPVRMGSLPAGIGIGTETGVDNGNGRFIGFILKVHEKPAKLLD